MTVKERTLDNRYQVWVEIGFPVYDDGSNEYETIMVNSYSDPTVAEHARHILVRRPGSFIERAWIEDTHHDS